MQPNGGYRAASKVCSHKWGTCIRGYAERLRAGTLPLVTDSQNLESRGSPSDTRIGPPRVISDTIRPRTQKSKSLAI